ncbi:MAG TPA: hypothetical protein VKS80_00440, partial [Trinickia sp.]|nr:hypothetical protein [Trinickia sp.]
NEDGSAALLCGAMPPVLAHPAIIIESARKASAVLPFATGDCTILSLNEYIKRLGIIFFDRLSNNK